MSSPSPSPRSAADRVCAVFALALLAALLAFSAWLWHSGRQPLLLAPAIGGLHDCLDMAPPAQALEAACEGASGSAAERVEKTLSALGPPRNADGRFALGYTLVVPLLNLFEPQAGGGWAIDTQAVQRITRTVQHVQRPVVLYLFSTHFSEGAPIEPVLAQDPRNLAETPHGPLPVDRYMGRPLYPWSIARTDNPLTQRREQAIDALAQALCAAPGARARLAGINLLGEVHHHYPHFESGMGYGRPYVITDYSPASREGFRAFLRERFGGRIEALNRHLGTAFARFDEIEPPAGNSLQQPSIPFWQHLDDAAAGTLAVGGWVFDATQPATRWVRVYLNGQPVARVPAHFMRQDVADARPDFGTAKVGWRHDLRFAHLPAGRHRLDVALERPGASLVHLGTRHFSVINRQPGRAAPMHMPLPPMRAPDLQIHQWIDAPTDERTVLYNPLAPLWHAWRNQQVVNYLSHFDQLLAHSCLADVPRRTQQIYPAENAGWDASRFASEQSLRPFGHVGLGINLYGEATYDDSFFTWLTRSGQRSYAVTEFHPMRAMSAADLRHVLLRHQAHGARSVSFFLHPWQPSHGTPPGAAPNPFALDPANPAFGSDQLYQSMQSLLR
ncbi:MAG: beta-galactosidase [Pseudomonadota bacterium]|nr:beta-galactosidase [Pseudomonadota bacterium]